MNRQSIVIKSTDAWSVDGSRGDISNQHMMIVTVSPECYAFKYLHAAKLMRNITLTVYTNYLRKKFLLKSDF